MVTYYFLVHQKYHEVVYHPIDIFLDTNSNKLVLTPNTFYIIIVFFFINALNKCKNSNKPYLPIPEWLSFQIVWNVMCNYGSFPARLIKMTNITQLLLEKHLQYNLWEKVTGHWTIFIMLNITRLNKLFNVFTR